MIRLELANTERAAARARRRDRYLAPTERDLVEVVLLSGAGWPPPRIAAHLGCCAATVRTALKGFGASGPAGLRRGRPGPPKDDARRAQVTAVLDNAGFHRSATIHRARPDLRTRNVSLYYPPPYAPELNAIEPLFRAVKHRDLPARRYATAAALEVAVDAAFVRVEAKVLRQCQHQPRRAA